MADWEGGAEGGERQRNVSAETKRTKRMEAMNEGWMDQHLVAGRGGPSLSTGRGGCAWRAWRASKTTSRWIASVSLSVVVFSLSRQCPSNSKIT